MTRGPRAHLARPGLNRAELMATLTCCEWCGTDGPTARLAEHIAKDHSELVLDERVTNGKSHAGQFVVAIPSRFRNRLERIRAQSGRSFGQIIAASLDAQGLGRQRRPRVVA